MRNHRKINLRHILLWNSSCRDHRLFHVELHGILVTTEKQLSGSSLQLLEHNCWDHPEKYSPGILQCKSSFCGGGGVYAWNGHHLSNWRFCSRKRQFLNPQKGPFSMIPHYIYSDAVKYSIWATFIENVVPNRRKWPLFGPKKALVSS